MQTSLGRVESRSTERPPTPFVKWAGGKRQLLSAFRDLFPSSFGRYFEPFIGGGAVFLDLRPRRATLSDLNPELMNCWVTARDNPVALMRLLDAHVYEQDYYYGVRSLRPEDLDPAERAARFIYLNKSCYNGLYRVNRKGQFNVPFGRYARPPQLYGRENIHRVSRLLKGVKLLCASFELAVASAKRGDFVYVDPPYQPLSKTAYFTSYTDGSFTKDDQKRLADVTRDLDRRGCLVAVSNSNTPYIRRLYSGFRKEKVLANRAINSKASGRGKITELLITNYR